MPYEALKTSERGARMQEKLLGEHLDHWARETPEVVALRFQDFLSDPAGIEDSVTYAELKARVDVAAARLQAECEPGDRVAIMAPQSLAYIVYFIAALRAGVIAVPLFSPDLPGHGERLVSTFADCEPQVVLCVAGNQQLVRDFLRSQPGGLGAELLVISSDPSVDDPDVVADDFVAPDLKAEDLAYIQYTSGSTRLPAGVQITQGNIVANSAQAIVALHELDEDVTVVSWLPLFHDMGLVFVVGGSVVGGLPTVCMDPISFLIDPLRWIFALADNPHAISLAPNFAYAYAASKADPERMAGHDMSGVRCLGNGAEPVRPETLDDFQKAYGPFGLNPHTVRPVYGLAEATVYVCGGAGMQADGTHRPVVDVEFDLVQLSNGVATLAEGEQATPMRMVSVDLPNDQLMAIADPETGEHLPEGRIGEIWTHGPNVADGYWGKDDKTAEVFNQTLVNPRGELPEGPWMRTGDLGVLFEGSMFITGRIKDLIIVGGRNHYPQDLEASVEAAHPAIARHRTAAFSVDTPDGEAVVMVCEISRHAEPGSWNRDEVHNAAMSALSRRHSVAAHDVVLVEPRQVPKTSSGKIARSACRDLYLAKELVIAQDGR